MLYKIILELRRSRFVVADFTGSRTSIYFEAGRARGHGLPVIWTCHKGETGSLAFDTRQYPHILWDRAEDLREHLYNRIKAQIG